MDTNLKRIVDQFDIKEDVLSIEPYGNGHINRTYLLTTSGENNYILQVINTYAFKDPDLLMNNIVTVTKYLEERNIETLNVIFTKDGKSFFNEDGTCYRVYLFVKDSATHEKIENMAMVQVAAEAFGDFHQYLSGLDASKLGEVIKDFHNTPKRYETFENTLEKDKFNRAATCQDEINTVHKYKFELDKLTSGLKDGSIPSAVTHNDPKINNVLFDAKTDLVRCVIDLDTIMPGSRLYDFGDALRSLFTGENEDSTNLDLLVVNYDIYKAYLTGYYKKMKSVITPKEISLLPYSAFLLTIECGIRFLEDYLNGDVYFHTKYDTHNLVRARTQLTLAENIYKNIDKLNNLTQEVIKSL